MNDLSYFQNNKNNKRIENIGDIKPRFRKIIGELETLNKNSRVDYAHSIIKDMRIRLIRCEGLINHIHKLSAYHNMSFLTNSIQNIYRKEIDNPDPEFLIPLSRQKENIYKYKDIYELAKRLLGMKYYNPSKLDEPNWFIIYLLTYYLSKEKINISKFNINELKKIYPHEKHEKIEYLKKKGGAGNINKNAIMKVLRNSVKKQPDLGYFQEQQKIQIERNKFRTAIIEIMMGTTSDGQKSDWEIINNAYIGYNKPRIIHMTYKQTVGIELSKLKDGLVTDEDINKLNGGSAPSDYNSFKSNIKIEFNIPIFRKEFKIIKTLDEFTSNINIFNIRIYDNVEEEFVKTIKIIRKKLYENMEKYYKTAIIELRVIIQKLVITYGEPPEKEILNEVNGVNNLKFIRDAIKISNSPDTQRNLIKLLDAIQEARKNSNPNDELITKAKSIINKMSKHEKF